MAEAIKDRYGIKSELVASDGGAFEVIIDGEKIFSKLQSGRFPEHGEILGAIENMKA
ncbi:MAG: Rdx family protein [Candidatus Zixiibacteriota bacterium]|nr:MAG: Rdx family protein [candidate division Zixibacteria bacterium]